MAGLLAWAADVVGGNGAGGGQDDDEGQFPAVVFTPEQEEHVRDLDVRAASLRRTIHDLRQRIPPADVEQRLPHLHAHSVASNADLALQLNAHSSTRQQAQLREETLKEENITYEKAISACQKKIQDKLQEANLLQSKLKAMDLIEKDLRTGLEKIQTDMEATHSRVSLDDSEETKKIYPNKEPPKSVLLEQLDEKKKELSSLEATVQSLEDKWTQLQHNSLRQPSASQREKALEKQLHGLVEQLTAKQAQAEGLISEIKAKERELEKLNRLPGNPETASMDENTARNRFGRSSIRTGSLSTDYTFGGQYRYPNGGRAEGQQKGMLLWSAFVLYILILHILVFIKISF